MLPLDPTKDAVCSRVPPMTPEYKVPLLPVPRTTAPRTAVGRWLFSGEDGTTPGAREAQHPWHKVLWLTGVDYFSTLGYQPGIALLAAGALSPIATLILVAVTLLGAYPVYAQVAKRSYAGQGSIAMLESLLPKWRGKLLVLILLGFAGTDFVITMTLSAADATQHAIENPLLHPFLGGDPRLLLTLGLLAILAGVFLKGFKEAIGVALWVAVPYLLLNLVVLVRGALEIVHHPEFLDGWRSALSLHGDWRMALLASAILFPKLALGLSGFETGVSVMPLIQGASGDERKETPEGRIRGTRRLLLTVALIMSLLLVASSFVTTMLIPPEAYAPGGAASGRALAYLAHGLLGDIFGSVYDLWTILILWFAGASAMAGLLNLIPRYLPRFGMLPQWAGYRRPLVLVLFGIASAVTWIFQADVEAQGGAYATGVLVLMLSAAFAVSLVLWREFRDRRSTTMSALGTLGKSGYFWLITGIFAFTLVDNMIGRPDGLIIAAVFVALIVVVGAVSRFMRSTELRVSEISFENEESVRLWKGLVGKKVNLVPLSTGGMAARIKKAAEIREYYKISAPIAFLHVNLMDNRSEFLAPLRIRVSKVGEDFDIEVSGAIAIANTVAYLSELLDPVGLFIGLTGKNLMTQAIRFLFWGEGETALMAYKILVRYWEWTEEADVKPRIFLMSA